MRWLVILAALFTAPALAQENQIVPAVQRCGAQLGQLAIQNYSLVEQVERLTVERDALKKELAAAKKPTEAPAAKP